MEIIRTKSNKKARECGCKVMAFQLEMAEKMREKIGKISQRQEKLLLPTNFEMRQGV